MLQSYLNYANAFYLIALENNKVDNYRDAAISIRDLFKNYDVLIDILNCQFIEISTRLDVVDQLFKGILSNDFINSIKVLISDHKIRKIVQILDNFINLCNKKLNIKEGIVYFSEDKIDKKVLEKLEKILSKKINKKVYLKGKVDTSLIGGIKIAIDGHVYDGSLQYQLKQLQLSLLDKTSSTLNK